MSARHAILTIIILNILICLTYNEYIGIKPLLLHLGLTLLIRGFYIDKAQDQLYEW